MLNIADVRDVAEAHCLALIKPDLDGRRILISGGTVSYD